MFDTNSMPPMGGFPFGPGGGKPPMGGFPFAPGGGKPPFGAPPLVDVSHIRRSWLDVAYDSRSDAQKLDVFLPEEGEGPFPLLIHIHGGGFALGDKRDGHIKKLLDCLDKGWAFATINYRLSAEAVFPAAVEDCKKALAFLRENAANYQIDPARMATIGGSAGGNLSAMMAMTEPVVCAVDWFGPTDFAVMDRQARTNGFSFPNHDEAFSAESAYLGMPLPEAEAALIQKANPMHYISESMKPLLIEHGSVDKLVPPEQSKILYEAICEKLGPDRARYFVIGGADHEDRLFESDENMALVWAFLEKYLI